MGLHSESERIPGPSKLSYWIELAQEEFTALKNQGICHVLTLHDVYNFTKTSRKRNTFTHSRGEKTRTTSWRSPKAICRKPSIVARLTWKNCCVMEIHYQILKAIETKKFTKCSSTKRENTILMANHRLFWEVPTRKYSYKARVLVCINEGWGEGGG